MPVLRPKTLPGRLGLPDQMTVNHASQAESASATGDELPPARFIQERPKLIHYSRRYWVPVQYTNYLTSAQNAAITDTDLAALFLMGYYRAFGASPRYRFVKRLEACSI